MKDMMKLDSLVHAYQGEVFEKMKQLIAIDSVSGKRTAENAPFGDECRKALDLFIEIAGDMGFETYDCDGYAAHAQFGHGEKTMGILGHLDIVPAGEGWTQDPFGGEIVDGKCYGRGTLDDKGPLLAALFALKAVKESGIPLKHGVRVIAGCDEEVGMSDMRHYASKLKMPDYGFSPDAEYPLINIEKGAIKLVISATMQPNEGKNMEIYQLNAGERANVVPGLATAEVSCEDLTTLDKQLEEICAAHEKFHLEAEKISDARARIIATGIGAHASTPHAGINAAGMLLIALTALGAGDIIAALSEKIGMESDGESIGISCKDELSGALTCNLGLMRYDGEKIEVTLDIRYPLYADEARMTEQAQKTLAPFGLTVVRTGGHVPLHVPADSEVVKGLLEVYHDVTGLPAYPIAIGGGTYSRMMPNTVAFGINFPGEGDRCHMPDEYVDVEKFMLSVKVMAHAIVRLAGR